MAQVDEHDDPVDVIFSLRTIARQQVQEEFARVVPRLLVKQDEEVLALLLDELARRNPPLLADILGRIPISHN
jgi:hypothetical protein